MSYFGRSSGYLDYLQKCKDERERRDRLADLAISRMESIMRRRH